MHIGITLWKSQEPGDLSSIPINQQMIGLSSEILSVIFILSFEMLMNTGVWKDSCF